MCEFGFLSFWYTACDTLPLNRSPIIKPKAPEGLKKLKVGNNMLYLSDYQLCKHLYDYYVRVQTIVEEMLDGCFSTVEILIMHEVGNKNSLCNTTIYAL